VAVVRNTFVLTQAFCLPPQAPAPGTCREQSVPVGATLEIQLPGTPSAWTIVSAPPALKRGVTRKLASPGRIEGTADIYVFRFTALKAGQGQIVFREAPAHLAKPGGSFAFPIVVTAGPRKPAKAL
jgi:hypothetical protein